MGDRGSVSGWAEDVARSRLQASACCFVVSIARALGDREFDEFIGSLSFDDVLTALHEHACAIGFGGMGELTEVIDVARVVEDASTLESLDGTLTRLHARWVLQERARAARANAHLD